MICCYIDKPINDLPFSSFLLVIPFFGHVKWPRYPSSLFLHNLLPPVKPAPSSRPHPTGRRLASAPLQLSPPTRSPPPPGPFRFAASTAASTHPPLLLHCHFTLPCYSTAAPSLRRQSTRTRPQRTAVGRERGAEEGRGLMSSGRRSEPKEMEGKGERGRRRQCSKRRTGAHLRVTRR